MLKEQPRGVPFTLRLVGPKKAFGEWEISTGFTALYKRIRKAVSDKLQWSVIGISLTAVGPLATSRGAE